jgi:hypothetical protein
MHQLVVEVAILVARIFLNSASDDTDDDDDDNRR